LLSGLILSFLFSFLFLWYIDYQLNQVLNHYIDSEVDRVTSIIIGNALKKVNQQDHYSFFYMHKNQNIIENISYDTYQINLFQNELRNQIWEEFQNIERGDFHSYSLTMQDKLRKKYPYFSNGYLCEVSMNSLRGSSLFGNVGPTIPIKLSFMGFVDSNIDVQIKEYGINNVIVEVDVIVTVSNMISMPISSRVHNVLVKQVLSMEVIPGEVPRYYTGIGH